jgi:hypothetical protein
MRRLSDAMPWNLAGIVLALLALGWMLFGASATGTVPVVRIGVWTPLPAGSQVP